MMFHYCIGFLLVSSLLSVTHGASKLESYNIDPSSVTVSGLSSGGAMAMQFHIAFSDIVHGAGIFAGLPFSCAKGGLVYANLCMTNPGSQNVATLVGNIDGLASSGKVDPTSNLSGDKVFIFHGTKDTTVYPAAGTKINEIYEHYDVETLTKLDMGAVHGFPTDFYGAACGQSSATTQYINNCDYHGAYEMLNYLYDGTLVKPTKSVPINGLLTEYDQAEFGATNAISMDPIGYVYVPTGCEDRTKQCKFHISLHGCQQSRATINDIYAKNTGYLEVAELNDIVVIFPQTKANMLIGNPNACWDWWGYLNVNYLNQDGAQMQALYKMLDRVVYCDGKPDCFDEVTSPPEPTNPEPTNPDATTPPPSGLCEPNTVTFHPFPGLCEYYTMCACGVEVLLHCAPGLWFDISINNCNFIQLVDCEPSAETADVSHNFFQKFYYNLK